MAGDRPDQLVRRADLVHAPRGGLAQAMEAEALQVSFVAAAAKPIAEAFFV